MLVRRAVFFLLIFFAICNSCRYRTDSGICRACGCGLKGEIFGKAILRTEKCPLGKWPIIYKE